MTARRIVLILVSLLIGLLSPAMSRADASQAWAALHRLDVPRAIELFQAARKDNPDDHALIRGLILAYHLDGRIQPQLQLLHDAIELDPSNPYNLALYEHLAAELNTDASYHRLQEEYGDSLQSLPPGAMRFCGRMILGNNARATLCDLPEDWKESIGAPPGVWISGPYENGSQVCAVRTLPGEASPLDTTDVASGKNGVWTPWVYENTDRFGNINPGAVMEDRQFAAVQVRCPFRLDSDRDVVIVIGGYMHFRLRVDGQKVAEDRLFSNAVIRNAVRVPLAKGEHEITLVAGWRDVRTGMDILLLDTLYQPIPGLTWLRSARPVGVQASLARPVNPIFDSFESFVSAHGDDPDTRYWRAILHMYNARSLEAVQELERLEAADSLSLLERFCLYQALNANQEQEQANRQLNLIRQQATTPAIELLWLQASEDDNATNIRKAIQLDKTYPGRPMIEAMATAAPLLDGDIAGFLQKAQAYQDKYPDQLFMSASLLGIYQNVLQDNDAALKLFLDVSRRSQDQRSILLGGPNFYVQAKKFDEGVALGRQALEAFPQSDVAVNAFVQAAVSAGRTDEALAVLDSLIAIHPTNIDLQSLAYDLCNRTDRHERAHRILETIHRLKPTAWAPYKQIDSLHNNAPYDSIFTTVDVMSLWGDPPPEKLLNGQGEYTLVDRRQVIIFESGAAYCDIQRATVVLDRSTVEKYQQVDIGFPPSDDAANLLVARRLRKGSPPHAGVHDGTSIYFKDLQPGDAIEIHFRLWKSAAGDLWRQYWDEYQAKSENFQRLWEYSILTNRTDCHFASVGLDVKPVVDTHCNYTRTTWRGENVPPVDYSATLTPPHDDLMGKIFTSTLADWTEVGDWYAAISEAVLNDNPRADQLARQLAAGAANDREKLHRLYEYIVFEIPYQVMDFNYSAAVPHTPDEVLINHWGDCKDKGHLLIDMLREVGIRSWPTLVMTRTNGSRLPIPYMGFDHLIVGCIIDGDTLYVDPTSDPAPPEYSLGRAVAGQPCLNVLPHGASFIGTLPAAESADFWQNWTLTLRPSGDSGQYRYRVARDYGNQVAGVRRFTFRDRSTADLKKDKESYFSDDWGVAIKVDSLGMDSLNSIAPVFSDWFSGTVTLSTQQIGNTTLIQPPHWCPFRNSLSTDILGRGERTYPVDLRYVCGDYTFVLKLEVPPSYEEPQVPAPTDLVRSGMKLDYASTYDKDSHELVMTYRFHIGDGQVTVKTFQDYLKTLIGAFDSPILLRRRT